AALKERALKIKLANDVVDLGNIVRISAWLSIATRQADELQKVRSNFKAINDVLDELNKICLTQANK
ncbi:MAG TPA: hypothetical protein DCS43_16515, partial [Verrucomicrobia bacterium]|nr:hypothetical protein [Verrucomicrobiota bacterium]